MKKRKLNLLILFSLLGLGVSIYLTVKHFQILRGGLLGASFCNFNEKFDCDSLLMSRFAQLGPFSLGGLGLVYFLYLLFPFLYARLAPDAVKSTLALPFLSTLPAVVLILYLAVVSSFILKSYCIFCVSIYLIIFAVFFLLKSVLEIPFSKIGSFTMNYFKKIFGREAPLPFQPSFFGNFLYAFVVAVFGLFILYSQENKYASDYEDFDHQAFLDYYYQQKPVSLEVTGHPYWGKEGAPITIVEFSDFECPFCKRAAVNLKPRLREHQKDIQFFFFQYPLDRSCNPYLPRDMHEQACDAARAALCANQQGKFWPYHDLLFDRQPDFSRNQLTSYAKKVGLNPQSLLTCMDSEETKSKILADIEVGKNLQLEGTPTIYINGRLMKDWLNPVMLNLVIDEELRRAHATSQK
jgi:protein-disulfide isomerase/uncharacterized membrane protein